MTCDNGQDALRLAIEHRPDIVVADLDMPGLTGAELCQAIRDKPSLAATKVVLLCGSFDQVDESRLEKIPADGRLWKPFESHVLTALLEALLKQDGAGSKTMPPIASRGSSLRESDAPTMAPIPRESAAPTAAPTDIARDLASETFRTVPPPSPASTVREKVLPVADVSTEQAMANLWSPDLAVDENEATMPPITPVRDDAATMPPLPPPPTSGGSEFSSFRHVVEPTRGGFSETEIPIENSKIVELESTEQEWVREARELSSRQRGESSDLTIPPIVPPPAHGVDEDTVRRMIQDEIQKAFEGRLKAELEKQLAAVMAEINRA